MQAVTTVSCLFRPYLSFLDIAANAQAVSVRSNLPNFGRFSTTMNACRGAVADHLSAFRLCLSSLVGLDPSRLWRVSQGPAKHRIPSRDVFDPILPCAHAHVGGHRLCRNLARAEPRRRRTVSRHRSRERQGCFCPECRVSRVSPLPDQTVHSLSVPP